MTLTTPPADPPAAGAPVGPVAADPWRPPRWWAALAGLVAVGSALGAGQLAAGLAASLEPPVVSVGNRVVDAAPRQVKDFAVATFGTSDKTALITGTVVILTALGVAAGIVALRRALLGGLAIVAAFGVLGVVAATSGRNATGNGWVPSSLSALAAGAALVVCHRLSRPPAPPTEAGAQVVPGASRRTFLLAAGGLAATAAVLAAAGRGLRGRFSADLERAAVRLGAPRHPRPAPPPDPALGIERLTPLFVPNDDFYRIDTALLTPAVTAADWSLRIDGMVDRQLSFTYDELWSRELVEYDITLSCVSNEVGGSLVGNARWLGVRLDALLAEAGVQPDADQIMGHSVDGFTAGFPVGAVTDGRDTIVALAMNGEVLPVAHGYPARLVVPGLYGYVSATKWLKRIELTRFDRADGYWIPRGWAALGPIKTQSRIDTPRPTAGTGAGDVAVAGVAWAPGPGIERVEVQIDDGPWQEANLGPDVGRTSWRQWWLTWRATPGTHRLRCRATDGTGTVQTEQRASPAPDGASGWHTINVEVSG